MIGNYSWSFGDGATGTGVAPSHTYAAAGNYTVILKVTGSLGLTATTSRTVNVQPPPVVQQPKTTVTPPPRPVTRPPLSGSVSSAKHQKLVAVLKRGLKVTVSTNTPAKASFVIAMPAPTVKQKRQHGRRVVKQKMTTIFRSGALSFTPRSHSASLKLSAAGASKLRSAAKPVVLTVRLTLTDVYGRKTSRSVKLTVTR